MILIGAHRMNENKQKKAYLKWIEMNVWCVQEKSCMNSTIRIHAQHIHRLRLVFFSLLEFINRTRPLHVHSSELYVLEQCRWNQEKTRRASKNKIARKKNLKLISKYIEWMTVWLSVRLQSECCLISVFAKFSVKYYNSSVNKRRTEHRNETLCNWNFMFGTTCNIGMFAVLTVNTMSRKNVRNFDCKGVVEL